MVKGRYHAKREKKKYSCDEAIEKFKSNYEKNIKTLKSEHDLNVESLKNSMPDEKTSNEYDEISLRKKMAAIDKMIKNSEYKTIALMEAEKIWLAVKIAAIKNDTFLLMPDEKKIDLICRDFSEFHNNFPIVTKYMVCMGQYTQKAFKKFLSLCDKKLTDAPADRKKGYMEEQWIFCQAQYVRYLWESVQMGRISKHESDKIYNQAYAVISNDFKRFREIHANMEKNIEKDKKKHKIELLKEAAQRLISNEQQIEIEKMRELISALKDKKYEQNYNNVIYQINEEIELIKASHAAYGNNEEAQQNFDEEMRQNEMKKKYNTISSMGRAY